MPHEFEQHWAVVFKFFASHALHLGEFVEGGGAGERDFAQGGVVEDDVGGHVAFAGLVHAPGAQAVEEGGGHAGG